jgi:hypothetical protein
MDLTAYRPTKSHSFTWLWADYHSSSKEYVRYYTDFHIRRFFVSIHLHYVNNPRLAQLEPSSEALCSFFFRVADAGKPVGGCCGNEQQTIGRRTSDRQN